MAKELTIRLADEFEEINQDPPQDAEVIFSLMAFEETFDVFELLLEEGYGPTKIIDFLAITVAGKDPYEWAEVRGVTSTTVIQHVEEMDVAVEALRTHGSDTSLTRQAVKSNRGP